MPDPRSSSRIQPATLSRKYRSCVMATTVPGYSCRCRSSQATDSASRWLVGSSSRSRSGRSSRMRHKATRRRSPPESLLTSASPGGQRIHGDLERAVELPAVLGLDLVLQLALVLDRLLHVLRRQVGIAQAHRDLFETLEQPARFRNRLFDVAQHRLAGIELRL